MSQKDEQNKNKDTQNDKKELKSKQNTQNNDKRVQTQKNGKQVKTTEKNHVMSSAWRSSSAAHKFIINCGLKIQTKQLW